MSGVRSAFYDESRKSVNMRFHDNQSTEYRRTTPATTPQISVLSVTGIGMNSRPRDLGSSQYRPSRRASFLTVIEPSTKASTIRPTLFLPARSTAIRSPSWIPSSSRLSPQTLHQNVAEGCLTIHAMGSISSSRSSAAGDGNPAGTRMPESGTVVPTQEIGTGMIGMSELSMIFEHNANKQDSQSGFT